MSDAQQAFDNGTLYEMKSDRSHKDIVATVYEKVTNKAGVATAEAVPFYFVVKEGEGYRELKKG